MNKQNRKPGAKKKNTKQDIEFTVTKPMGLLEFLLMSLPKKSRNNVKSLLTHREVLVDEVVTTQYDTALKEGQKIRIIQTLIRDKEQEDRVNILYEDDDILVVNKPSGLLTIATDKEKDFTAYHLLTDYVKLKNPQNRIFVVHRLDRDTSGILMVAKNEEMKLALQDNWANLVSDRAYIAVVEGRLKEKSGRIQSWLKQTKTLVVYSSSRSGDGLEAITDYQVLNEKTNYSLLDIHLQTGRKNQIRVHMKDIGHNVVGDKKYGAKTNPLRRLGLHSYKLQLKHPFSDEVLCFQTPLPESFASFFEKAKPNE